MEELFQNADQTKADELKALIESVFNDSKIEMKTVIEHRHVVHLARAMLYADQYQQPEVQKLAELMLKLRVSGKGRGRNDMIKALQSYLYKGEDEQQDNIRKRLLG